MSWIKTPVIVFGVLSAVILAAFLLGVGLGPNSLPFPPVSDFSDAVTSHWPNALFLRRTVLHDHTWPLWRPTIMSGQPFAANPLNKVWYPPQWLVFLLPPALHLNLLTWLHLVLAGMGAWLWSQRTGLTPRAAGLVGLGYALGPRLIAAVGAGHLDLVYAAAWFPWLLWAIERLLTAERNSEGIAAVAGFATLCFLADVRLSAYVLAASGAYLIWRSTQISVAWKRLSLRILTAALLTAGLTAVQWLPLLLYRTELSRSSIDLDDAATSSLQWGQWIGLLIGDHGGGWESLIYVGVSTLALALVALLRQPRRFAFWGGLLIFVMVYAVGDHFVVWPALNRLLPFLRWWRVPPRIWFIAALVLPYLAGWGAQLLAQQPSEHRLARLSVVGLLGGGLVCGIFSTLTLSSAVETTALLGTFALPAVALVMLLAIFGRASERILLTLFAVVITVDVLWIDRTLVEGRAASEWLDPYAELAHTLQDDGAVRVYSPSYSLPQQVSAEWDLAQFDGVDPFQLRAYVTAFETATGVTAEGYSVTLPAFALPDDADPDLNERDLLALANRDATLDPAELGKWLVTHVVSAFEIDHNQLELLTTLTINDQQIYVYRNTAAPPAQIVWHSSNHATVTLEGAIPSPVYAIANGHWRDQTTTSPGLPAEFSASDALMWDYHYSWREVTLSLLIGSLLLIGGLAEWWRLHRA